MNIFQSNLESVNEDDNFFENRFGNLICSPDKEEHEQNSPYLSNQQFVVQNYDSFHDDQNQSDEENNYYIAKVEDLNKLHSNYERDNGKELIRIIPPKSCPNRDYQVPKSKSVLEKLRPGQETKNIPKNFGVHLRNFIVEETSQQIQKIAQIQIFINKKTQNPSYSYGLADFIDLFSDERGKQIGRIFFGNRYWIQRILGSDRINDINLFFKYFKNFYQGCFNPEQLKNLKQ